MAKPPGVRMMAVPIHCETVRGDVDRGKGGEAYEAAVGGEGGGTKGVADGHLPHAGEQLDETAVGKGRADDDVGGGGAACAQVDESQQEGGQGESAEAQRGRVGDAAVLELLEQTGLQFTAKGGQTRRGVGVLARERVAAVVVASRSGAIGRGGGGGHDD